MTVRTIQQPHLKAHDKKQILEKLTKGKLEIEFKDSPQYKPKVKVEEPVSS